jgi:DNA repair exonuclease SbcCD nuclease subunit
MMFSIVVDSDQHYYSRNGVVEIGRNKSETTPSKIIRIAEANKIDAIILAGDATENAYDGKKFCCGLGTNGPVDEIGAFVAEMFEPLRSRAPTFLIRGNHDLGKNEQWYQPFTELVKREYGDLYYSRTLTSSSEKSMTILMCDLYPTREIRRWMEAELQKDTHFVIAFHYNLIGEYSDWIPESDQKAFLEIAKKYKNKIVAIINGHRHFSGVLQYADIPVVMAAEHSSALMTIGDDWSLRTDYF